MQEHGDMSDGAGIDAMAETFKDFKLGGVAVAGENVGSLDRGIGREDVVFGTVDKEDGLGIRVGWKGGSDSEGAGTGDGTCGLVAQAGEGVESRHGAL